MHEVYTDCVINRDYLRNIVFGFEDGFVSTVGALVGIAVTDPGVSFVIVSGFVIISVEAFSMGIGSYISEKSVHEISRRGHTENLFFDALLMWMSYLTAGFIVLSPYILLQNSPIAPTISISLTIFGLFVLGYAKGLMIKKHPLHSGFEMMTIAGFAVLIGYTVGELGQRLLQLT